MGATETTSGVGPGTVIAGRYRLESLLGKGGMGSVWRAAHLELGSFVAVKILQPKGAASAHSRARFLREGRASALLRSPHVVQILELGEDEGMLFLVMELLEGESLRTRLRRERRLDPATTAAILTHVGRAMTRAHEAGIVHRDLKPDNVFLVNNDGELLAKVLDFGIAKAQLEGMDLVTDSPTTQTGSIVGTPYYMSPEQFRDSKHVGPATDRYALAVMIFELLAGHRPFEGRTIPELLRLHLEAPVPPLEIPKRLCTGMLHNDPQAKVYPTPSLDLFMARAMHKDPRLRYHSGAEMAAEFKKAALADGLYTQGELDPLFDPLPRPIAEISIEGRPMQRFDLRHGPLVFGRHESCQVVLASSRLSRYHACAYVHRGRLWVADLQSQNGSLLDDRRLTPGLPVPFPRGDKPARLSLYNRPVEIRLLPG
ncbi:MAG: protein kinase [Myxococcales bacterium]|nr:protein kinase [Myxococcales bacterium]